MQRLPSRARFLQVSLLILVLAGSACNYQFALPISLDELVMEKMEMGRL